MAKRGPKRKQGKRFANGRLDYRTKHVYPTAELLAKRIARFVIAGVKPDENNKVDLRLSESWLGVLYAARAITREQHDAGNHYHGLYKLMFPQGFPGSMQDPDAVKVGKFGVYCQAHETSDLSDHVDLAWRTSEHILAQHGKRAHYLVKNICVFGRFERFIDTTTKRPEAAWKADSVNKTLFACALDALAIAYGLKGRIRLAA